MTVMGPALIIEDAPDHRGRARLAGRAITALDHMVLTRVRRKARRRHRHHADPVMLEVFNNLFMSIAEQMGVTLQNTAYSVNIKERLDFSCAVFDADRRAGRQRAAHAGASGLDGPVGGNHHQAEQGKMKPGDVYALNAPYNGGTHLPDITVVTPVFDADGKEILFYTASRGHHADVGGMAPGSMTPLATTVDEEGVLIDNFKLVDKGLPARPKPSSC
jgi:5-oxoprolinase (ATP-hydrolysing)